MARTNSSKSRWRRVGFVTPFCTYSAIPMLVGFRQAGVQPAGYVAFIVAAPVLDPLLFGALVLIVGVSIVVSDSGDDFQEFAMAELVYTEGPDFDTGGAGHSAQTTWLEGDDEARVRFDVADLPAPIEGEDVELWLIAVDEAGDPDIISLGIVDDLDDPGTFDVPDDFSTADYDTVLVDLSFEPRDGVETHSGRSILRGPLAA